MSTNQGTPHKPCGANEPMSHRCITVTIHPTVGAGAQDCEEVEKALFDLNNEAIKTGRVVLSVQFYSTPSCDGAVTYTILAQWMGREEMERLSRLQQLGQSQHVPGGKMKVVQ